MQEWQSSGIACVSAVHRGANIRPSSLDDENSAQEDECESVFVLKPGCSRLQARASFNMESCITFFHQSHVTRHTSQVTRHKSLVTRHPSHVIHHTSHVTHHTSHITHHTSPETPLAHVAYGQDRRCCNNASAIVSRTRGSSTHLPPAKKSNVGSSSYDDIILKQRVT